MQDLLIFGSSGHAKVIIDIAEKTGRFRIRGLLDSGRKKGEETLGYQVLGDERDLRSLMDEMPGCEIFIAIGDNQIRSLVRDKVLNEIPDAKFASLIHPSAQIAKAVTIGEGVAVMAGAIINSASEIGDFVIINTGASLDHDCRMEEFSSLAPGVTTGGNVKIGAFSAVSIGAAVKHGVKIGKHTVVGAGSVLLDDCGDELVVYGVPAKEIRKRKAGEKYL